MRVILLGVAIISLSAAMLILIVSVRKMWYKDIHGMDRKGDRRGDAVTMVQAVGFLLLAVIALGGAVHMAAERIGHPGPFAKIHASGPDTPSDTDPQEDGPHITEGPRSDALDPALVYGDIQDSGL